MDEHAIRHILEGGGGWPGRLIRAGLWVPGKLYGNLMRLRRALYRCNLLVSHTPPLPTVSIGNLTAGGSGKTPFTIMLAEELLATGHTPGILLRGYRRSDDGLSDEEIMYRRLCPEALVEAGADRVASAKRAAAAGATILLMDDGLQHLRLGRDLDIVLVDATSPWGGGNTIPGGLLREPVSTLRQAAAVIITRSDQAPRERVDALKREIAAMVPGVPVLPGRHQPVRLTRLDGKTFSLSMLNGKNVVALSAIARPEAFHKTLADLGAVVVGEVAGRDHGCLDGDEIAGALRLTEDFPDGMVVATEKDQGRKIFSELADNNTKDAGKVFFLGIRQQVDDIEMVMDIIARMLARLGT